VQGVLEEITLEQVQRMVAHLVFQPLLLLVEEVVVIILKHLGMEEMVDLVVELEINRLLAQQVELVILPP
jgi:hypothetical protein